ncbi:MAG TPA: GTP pyrophosphokinase family protein [Metalysinibacillus jejuensis]|uniref:GTP pyrophosphokinase family protein n=1 Tax=Metalysinibacillus jejuensis TaxID=914327 RepID=A0A921NDD1_9BACL|nr:GTP pyrophosphokinase family protein [Metalysinibacillus jejuensis]
MASASITRKQVTELREELTRFSMAYKFALDEITTRVNILQEEFRLTHENSPIEHVSARVKSPESLFKKVYRQGVPLNLQQIRERIRDIAGIRLVCSFVSDIYRVMEMFARQSDIEIVEVKDYIKNPKPNGYQSLHIIMKVPVFMSAHTEKVYVEMQIRTIAMDFWASLEHKIYYKYNKQIPEALTNELHEAAIAAAHLDKKMERLNNEVNVLKAHDREDDLLVGREDLGQVMVELMENIGMYTK